MRVERELMRGAGPVAVLKLLERGEMYGYELVETLARSSNGVLAMGQSTLYPLLYNLEAKGLVRSKWKPGGQAEGGAARDRKYYSLTDRGRHRLAAETRQWNALAQAMSQIGVLGPAPAAREASA
jgi:PadR family transcriptional regulator PadR